MNTNPTPGRLNGVIKAFEEGRSAVTTFSSMEPSTATAMRKVPCDGVVFEMEHAPFDVAALSVSLQFLLDRKQIAASKDLAPAVTPMARITANGSEMNQWQAKQVLDQGVYGVVWPHVSTVEEARNAVASCRYARPPGAPYFEPAGVRGDGASRALSYWGLGPEEYYARADAWPLNPRGEILVAIMCEDAHGINNLRSILGEVPGIGAVLIGKSDLSLDLGRPRQFGHPAVAGAIDRALAICQECGVPCGLPGAEGEDAEKLLAKGFRWLMYSPQFSHSAMEAGRRAAGLARRASDQTPGKSPTVS